MAKHEIQIVSRKKMTEAIELSSVRQKRIAEQVANFISCGGEVQEIPRGVSSNVDSIARLHMSGSAKKLKGVKLS